MKTPLSLLLTVASLASLSAWSGPLDRSHIAADAKWVLHLDAESLQTTKVGAFFFDQILEPKSAQGKADLQREFGFELDWRKIQSITAYGRRIQPPGHQDPTGLLVVRTTMPVQAGLEAAMAKDLSTLRVRRVESPAAPVFCVNDKGFIAFAPAGVILAAQSLEAVEQGRAVVDGRAGSLAGATTFTGYPGTAEPVFFIAIAEGFADQTPLPSNAAMLKNAQGGRFAIGESGEKLLLNLNIRAVSEEIAQQMQQVAQGFIALAQLNATQKPELQALVQSTSITTSGTFLNVGAQVPVADVIRKMSERK